MNRHPFALRMRRYLAALLLSLVMCLTTLSIQAEPHDLRGQSDIQLPPTLDYQFLEDAQATPPNTSPESAWRAWPDNIIHLIGEKRQLWIRVPIILDNKNQWYLQSEWPQMGSIQAFIEINGQIQSLERLTRQRYPLFKLPDTTETAADISIPAYLYVGVHYSEISLVPLRLLSEPALQKWYQQTYLWLGVFFGFGIAVMLVNLIIGLSSRNSLFIWYTLFQLMVYTFEVFRFGMYAPFVGDLKDGKLFLLSAGLSFVLSNIFAIRLLEIPQRAPLFWKGFRIFIVIMTLYVCYLGISDGNDMLQFAMPVASLSTLLPLYALSLSYQVKGYVRMYTTAWILLIIGTLILNLNLVGWLPMNWFSTYGQLIGLSMESLLLSCILGGQLLDLQRERAAITSELLTLKNEANQRLQREVEEKTHALNQVLVDLQEANERLNERALTDPLTGVYNRRHFDDALTRAIARTAREGSSLSLAILDIDHFKSFNDRFGHLVGDECLRRVATLLQESLHRSEDLLTRFGGEEFALLLPATHHAGALTLLEELRARVENLDFQVNGVTTPITISGGCTTWVGNIASIDSKRLIEQADIALYCAKQQGRNRICSAFELAEIESIEDQSAPDIDS